jgi:hypothetical protein
MHYQNIVSLFSPVDAGALWWISVRSGATLGTAAGLVVVAGLGVASETQGSVYFMLLSMYKTIICRISALDKLPVSIKYI